MRYDRKIQALEGRDIELTAYAASWYKKKGQDLTKIGDFSLGEATELAVFHALRNNYNKMPFSIFYYCINSVINIFRKKAANPPLTKFVVLNFGNKKSVYRIYKHELNDLLLNNLYITSPHNFNINSISYNIKYDCSTNLYYIYNIWKIIFKLIFNGKILHVKTIFYFIQSSFLSYYSHQLSLKIKPSNIILSCPNCVGEKSFLSNPSIKTIQYYQHGSILNRCSALNSYRNSSINIANLWDPTDELTFRKYNTNSRCTYKIFNFWQNDLYQEKINLKSTINILFLASNTSAALLNAHINLIKESFNLIKDKNDLLISLTVTGYNDRKFKNYPHLKSLNKIFNEIKILSSETTREIINASHIVICSDTSVAYYLKKNMLRFIIISSGEHLYNSDFLGHEQQHNNPHSIAQVLKTWLK